MAVVSGIKEKIIVLKKMVTPDEIREEIEKKNSKRYANILYKSEKQFHAPSIILRYDPYLTLSKT